MVEVDFDYTVQYNRASGQCTIVVQIPKQIFK